MGTMAASSQSIERRLMLVRQKQPETAVNQAMLLALAPPTQISPSQTEDGFVLNAKTTTLVAE